MKRLLLVTSIALLLSSPAMAGKQHDRDHDDHERGRHHSSAKNHPPGKHKGWHKNYRRGEKVEVVYMAPKYYVDHQQHRLSAPPQGQRWIRHPDGRYLLITVATGIIADILLKQ